MIDWFASSRASNDKNTTNKSASKLAIEEPSEATHVQQFPEQTTSGTQDHIDDSSNDQIDASIAAALGGLTLHEREKVYHELHGVETIIEETPELLRTKLQEFSNEVNRLVYEKRHSKRAAYEYLLQLSTQPDSIKDCYWNDPAFHLKFLRAERFDVGLAADRFLRFFDLKRFLFGDTKLQQRHISIQDLNKEDMKTLKAGFIQLLPVRDRAGRAIAVMLPNFQTYKEPNNFTRVMFYMVMSAVDDEETQKKGCCAIVYSVAGEFVHGKTDLRTVSAGPWILKALPWRVCEIHQCFRDLAYRAIVNFSLRFINERDRAKVKIHFGSNVECIYSLMTYGVPPDPIPVTAEGDLKRKNHLDWIKMRRLQEDQTDQERIVVPSQSDVLFGRGKPFRQHIGNLRLHQLLEENLDVYISSRLKDKTALIGSIVDTIIAEGSRFLKQENGVWLQVDYKQAKEKVSHGFRTQLKISSNNGSKPKTNSQAARRALSYASESDSNTAASPMTSPMSSPLLSFDDHAATTVTPDPSSSDAIAEADQMMQNMFPKRARMSPEYSWE